MTTAGAARETAAEAASGAAATAGYEADGGAWRVSVAAPSLLDERRGPTRVHRALRHLVGACRAERRALPLMPVVTVGGGVLEAHLSAPLGRAPLPWRTHGHRWSVDLLGLPRSTETLDAYPALVELGRQDGQAVLVDLAAAPGLIEIDGPEPAVVGLLGRIVAGLLRAPWSRQVRIATLGTRSAADAHTRQIDRLTDVLPAGPVGIGGARGRWGSPPRGTHEVVVLGRPVEGDEHRLIQEASRSRGAPTVIAPGRDRGVWQWHVEAGAVTW